MIKLSVLCEHYEKCKLHTPNSIDRMHKNEFPTWFKKCVQDQRIANPQDVSTYLYALACSPNRWVATYSTCIINGKRFHSKQCEPWRWIQNSGVVVTGENLPNNLDFYSVINEILELRYMEGHHVYLFSCDWFDIGDQRRGVRVDVHMTSVNMSRTWYKDESFVLACQASQCYYVKDLRLKGNWYVVQKFTNSNVYDIPPRPSPFDDIDVESSDDNTYQEEVPSYEYAPMHCDDDPVSNPLSKTDIEPVSIDAAEVMHLGRHNENTIDLINNEVVAYGSEDGYGNGEYSDEEYFSTYENSMSN